MKNSVLSILLAVSIMTGCSRTGRLYPVQGPLSAQTPSPVFVAKLTGALNSGNVSVVLGSGEVAKGRWSVVPVPSAKGAAPATAPENHGMPVVWDTLYGPGFYVSHVLGTRLHAKAVVSGDRGTILNVDMYKGEVEHAESAGIIKGVAKDNHDNIYKLVF